MKAELDEPHESLGRPGPNPSQHDYGAVLDSIYEHYSHGGLNLKDFLSRVERYLLLRALSHFDGCQRKASEFLDMKPTTLNAKCKKFRIKFVKQPCYSPAEE
jgi:DNA-binding NtrC family response regulator